MDSAPKYSLPAKLADVVKGSFRHLKDEKELFAAMLVFFKEWPMVASVHSPVDFGKNFALLLAFISYGKNGVLKLDRGLRGVASGGRKIVAKVKDALSNKQGQETHQANNNSSKAPNAEANIRNTVKAPQSNLGLSQGPSPFGNGS